MSKPSFEVVFLFEKLFALFADSLDSLRLKLNHKGAKFFHGVHKVLNFK